MSSALQVVYDLRYAADHFTGIATHAHDLLQALLARPSEDRFTVLWHGDPQGTRFDLEAIRRHPRVQWCPLDIPPFTLRTRAATGAWLRAHRADVYLSPFWLAPAAPAMPTVLTLHDVRPLRQVGGEPWWKRALYRYAVDRAEKAVLVFTSSEFSRSEILSCTSLRPEQIEVMALGIDLPRDPTMTRPVRMPDGPFALVVGTNRPHKNHSLLARVWRAMGQRAPLQLVAAGASDPRYRNLHQLAPGLPTIHLLGKVSASELEWLYREATLVVFPTRYEGYGLPVIEAAVRGAPVLCSDIPALREVAGRFACLADPDDDEQWEREILRLSNDPEARASMRSAGLASTERLSYARIAESVHAHLVRVAMSRV